MSDNKKSGSVAGICSGCEARVKYEDIQRGRDDDFLRKVLNSRGFNGLFELGTCGLCGSDVCLTEVNSIDFRGLEESEAI